MPGTAGPAGVTLRSLTGPVVAWQRMPDALPSPSIQRPRCDGCFRLREVVDPWLRASIGQFRAGGPDARIVELPGVCHHLFIQRPAGTADEVAAFLRQR